MAPGTRSRSNAASPAKSAANTTKNQAQGASQPKGKDTEIIVLSSDSDDDYNEGKGKGRVVKRQKTNTWEQMDEDIVMLDAPPTPPHSVAASSGAKNAHLKGRKRFTADFADLKAQGLEKGGLAVTKIQKGDDEGMLDLVVVDRTKNDARVVACNIIISDTSEYPKHHTMLTYSEDADLPERVASALSALESAPAMPIGEALERLLTSLSGAKPAATKAATKPLGKGKSFATNNTASDEELESDEGSEAYDGYFSDNDYAIPSNSQARTTAAAAKERVTARIQRDFVEVVSSSYRPGLIPFTSGKWDPATDFAVSVSFATVLLTSTIPAQALVAWDRRLLASSKARYLVLLISGFNSGAGSSVHNVYPPLTAEGQYVRKGMQLRFQVGVCSTYKPSREHAVEAGRTFGLVGKDAEDEIREAKEKAAKLREAQLAEWGSLDPDGEGHGEDGSLGDFGGAEFGEDAVEDGVQEDEEGRFERFSLSSSLEALLDSQLVRLIGLRRQYGVGWAGAEMMVERVEREQRAEAEVWTVYRQDILTADADEARLARGGTLPDDPLRALPKGDDINLPHVAFCYLVRRLTLCTRYCLVCHNKLSAEFEALKPYVCDRPLCTYQYYAHNRGASLEYEIIHNPETVDLLLSLTYSAAAEGVVDEPLPVGMALRVPPPDKSRITTAPQSNMHAYHQPAAPAPAPANVNYVIGNDGLIDFDTLPVEHMRASIAGLIDTLPSIDDMKRHLERKVKPGKSKPRLKEMENGTVLPAAWSILRWCVASCTAYLEEMSSEEQCIQGLDPAWRQFRFSVGAPDAEAKFQKAQQKSTATDPNAKKYPSLYAFHGSALRNWHSIIRHGLWFKIVTNGRAYGDGVYLAKEAQTSMSHYAASGRVCWRKSKLGPTSCMALAEVVNLPQQFVSSQPHYVIKDTEWIMCRYLLVKGLEAPQGDASRKKKKDRAAIPFVKLDPAQSTTLMGKALQVPQPGHQIAQLVDERTQELVDEDHDETDAYIFADRAPPPAEVIDVSDDDEPMPMPAAKGKGKGKGASLVAAVSSAFKSKGNGGAVASGSGSGGSAAAKGPPKDDWKHDAAYVQRTMQMLMPPPLDSSPSATMAVQRELKAMLKEQDKAMVSPGGLKELGWYMPPELVGDNLFQWIVEMHSFDETLPIAKDLKREKVNSLIFEIRFGPTYPIGPPFFRIITPRFLPFMHGGGGHVTGGGSICMDLLTSDGWLPSYSISAVLMQIKLAISNLDPKPARLAQNWNLPYGVGEALAGFKRAAATHNWTVPDGFDKLVR